MNSYIRGNVREVFYKTDKGFMVGIFKIRETNDKELESYVNRTITDYVAFGNGLVIADSAFPLYYDIINKKQYNIFETIPWWSDSHTPLLKFALARAFYNSYQNLPANQPRFHRFHEKL